MSLPRVMLPVLLALLLVACGRSEQAAVRKPSFVSVPGLPWAQVSPTQVDAARAAGVPPAFENAWGMRFLFIPAGRFAMGSEEAEAGRAEDETRHEVDIGVGFFLQIEPVRVSELAAAGPQTEFEIPLGGGHAAALVPRDRALRIAAFLSTRDETWNYRLPTEAEWEYACRAGTATRFAWGDSAKRPAPLDYVNPWGLRGMHVGVREWCSDHYEPLPSWTLSDHGGPATGERVVARGGGTLEAPARSAHREAHDPRSGSATLGLRLVVPLGYGLGRYGATPVTFRLVDEKAPAGGPSPTGGYDLRVISMNDRLQARTLGIDAHWQRVPDPGSPVTLTMVPGAYYVYAERMLEGSPLRGKEMKFYVAADPIERVVPIPERDLRAYGSGAREKPQ